MTDTPKKILIDEDAVIRCLDSEMQVALKSHATFIISELVEEMKKPTGLKISIKNLDVIYYKTRSDGSYSFEDFYENITKVITHGTHERTDTISNMLIEGKTFSLLQPDGKGWQKGKIKLCFEFIPEETEVVETKQNLLDDRASPLDEIRNALIESN